MTGKTFSETVHELNAKRLTVLHTMIEDRERQLDLGGGFGAFDDRLQRIFDRYDQELERLDERLDDLLEMMFSNSGLRGKLGDGLLELNKMADELKGQIDSMYQEIIDADDEDSRDETVKDEARD